MNKTQEEAPLVVVDDRYNAETAGKLSAVRNAILAALAKDETTTEKVAACLLDAIEIKVRLGWLLTWGRQYLAGRGNWVRWLEENFTLSQPSLLAYMRFSGHFTPDLVAIQQRKSLGIELRGLAAVPGPSLRSQISLCQFKSFAEALRLTGLRPPLPAEAKALHNGKAAAKSKDGDDEQLAYIFEGLKFLEKRLRVINPANLSHEERESLFEHLTTITQRLREFGAS
jgi:hypothetical protein